MKKLITLISVFAIVLNGIAQVPYKFQSNLVPSSGEFNSNSCEILSDNSYLVGVNHFGGGSDFGKIVHLLNDGTVDWSYELRYSTSSNIIGLHEMSDGNIIVVISTYNGSGNNVFVACKFNITTGSIIWSKEFSNGSNGVYVNRSIRTNDDGVLIVGGYYSSTYKGLLTKITTGGSVLFQRGVDAGANIDVYGIQNVVEKTAGGFYLIGNAWDNINSWSLSLVLEANASGIITQQRNFGPIGTNDINPEGITFSVTGPVLSGSYYNGTVTLPLVIQLNSSLAVVNTYTYSGLNDNIFRFAHRKSNGNLLLTGPIFPNGSIFGDIDVHVVEVSSAFDFIAGYAYGDALGQDPFGIKQDGDNGLLISGNHIPNPPSGSGDASVVRIDGNLVSGCAESPLTLSKQSLSLSNSPIAMTSVVASLSVTTSFPTSASYGAIGDGLVCSVASCNISITGAVTNDPCGLSNGAVDVTITGAATPYTFTWSNGALTEDLTNVSAGVYTITVVDNNGCSQNANFSVVGAPAITRSYTTQSPTCFGGNDGSIDLTVSGGTPGYTYAWTGPGAFSSTNEDLTGLVSGIYNCVITDANGCSAGVSVTLSEPTNQMQVTSVSNNDPSCNGGNDGSATVIVTGGTPSYSYQWGANTGNQTTATASNLTAGTYTVVATDANGCAGQLTVTLNQPAIIQITDLVTAVKCNGQANGAIDITVTGGTSPYSYSWSNGPTSQDLTNLAFGSYSVVVTDNNGCVANAAYTVTQPAVLTAPITANNVSCNGMCDGIATANPAGGTAPYQYVWNDPSSQTTQSATGLCPGTLTVNVSDANNCQVTPSITITQPAPLSTTMTSNYAHCGLSDGSASVTPSGGTSPYTYAWGTGGTTSSETGLSTGYAYVTVTDANNCTKLDSVNVIVDVDPIDICVVTIDTSSTKNIIVWEKPASTTIDYFNVYRDVVGTYTLIASVPYDSLSQYTDTAVGINPNITSYRYKISAVDDCSNESVLSSFHQTMHLFTTPGSGTDIVLQWDNYLGFTFAYYRILRDTIGNGTWVAIDSVTNSNTSYTDINTALGTNNYLVEIVLTQSCVATRAENHNSSRSNRVNGISNGIADFNSAISAGLFPNPNTGEFKIELNVLTGNDFNMDIIDATGRLVRTEQLRTVIGKNTMNYSLQDLPNGSYYVRICNASNSIHLPMQIIR